MAQLDIIRAWKDEEYRLSLSEAERALLPAHPAGLIELTDAQLGAVEGGVFEWVLFGLGVAVIAACYYFGICTDDGTFMRTGDDPMPD
jgi:mersacidin/lichenicidin family type 2 lantibiotic